MHRYVFLLLLATSVIQPLRADQPTAAQKQATVKYLHSLRKDNGAFAADTKPESKPTVPATSSALRATNYFGGEVKNKEGAAKFVESCFNKKEGAFAATPGGEPDVRTTVIGLMALVELQVPLDEYVTPLVGYLVDSRIGKPTLFEDIRITAAGLETLRSRTNKQVFVPRDWVEEINKLRNADGSFGSGGNQARDTGSAAAALLRLGVELEHKDKIIQTLKAGQRPDGGWGKDGEKSDQESTYRVLRCLMMLKAKPDIAACEAFIARCRNADGSYSVQPGQPGSLSGTYFAGICLHWLEEMKK